MLSRNTYFIREHVGMLKLTATFDILDPETQQQIGIAREEPLVGWAKLLRLVVIKSFLPTTVNIYEDEQQPPVFSIHTELITTSVSLSLSISPVANPSPSGQSILRCVHFRGLSCR